MKTILMVIFTALALGVGTARAQQQWVQVEAVPTLGQAEERARAWSATFPDVEGFRLASGWYAVVLGPYTGFQAEDRLIALRSERLIPNDAFLSDGSNFSDRFWPVGASNTVGGPSITVTPNETQVIVVNPTPQELPDETPAEARRSEAALSEDERKQLQVALQWFGFYNSAIDGAFGRGTRGSMASWQGANGFDQTGVLTSRQRAVLLENYRGELKAMGLGHVIETRAGIELDMPIELVEFDDYAPPFVRYREKDGSGVQVLLISQEGTQATLDGLFDVMQTLTIVPLNGFREKQGDHFELTGQNAEIHSYTYARLEDGMVKGFTLVYPPSQEGVMQRAIAIMKDSMVSTGPALDPTLGSQEAAQSRDLLSGLDIRQPERTRSGVYVDRTGAVLTAAEAVRGCARITLDDEYEATLAAEDASGLALLRPKQSLAPMGVAQLAAGDPRIGAAAAVAGYSFGPALPAATVTFGKVEDVAGLAGERNVMRISAETEDGDVGGPVFDPSGQVAGLLVGNEVGNGKALPPGVRFAVKADVAAAFLATQGVQAGSAAPAGAMAHEDITDAAMDMTVLVSCWN